MTIFSEIAEKDTDRDKLQTKEHSRYGPIDGVVIHNHAQEKIS